MLPVLFSLFLLPFLPIHGANIELTPDFLDNLLYKPILPLEQFSSSWRTSGFCDTSSASSPPQGSLDVIKRLFFSQMATFPELSLIYAGFEDDGFYGYSRNTSTSELEFTVRDPSDPVKAVYNVAIDSVTSLEPSPRDVHSSFAPYSLTGRPWYRHFTKKAEADDLLLDEEEFPPYWSDVYAFAEKGEPLGMTLSKPIYQEGNSSLPIVGVLGVDFRLLRLSDHLAEIFNKNIVTVTDQDGTEHQVDASAAFVIEQATHEVVAASHYTASTFNDGEERVKATSSEDPMIESITKFLTEHVNPETGKSFIPNPYNISAGNLLPTKYKDFSIQNHYVESINTFKDLSVMFWQPKIGENKPEWIVVVTSDTQTKPSFISQDHGKASKRDYEFIATVISITLTFSAICLVFTLYYRNTNIIKLSQPTFLALLPVGGIATALSLYTFVGIPNSSQCRVRFGLVNIPFTFTFSCFLWKVHRAWKVAKAVRYMKKIKFTNADVYIYILSVTFVDGFLQLLSALIYPSYPQYRFELSSVGAMHPIYSEAYNCYNDIDVLYLFGGPFVFLSCLLKLGLIAFGCVLCYRTKSFSGNYAESTALLFTIYTVAISGAVFLTTGFVEKRMQFRIFAGAVLFNVCLPFCFLFLPRMIRLGFYGDITQEELMERTQKMRLKQGAAKKMPSAVGDRKSTFKKRPTTFTATSSPILSQGNSGAYNRAISQAFNKPKRKSAAHPTGPKRSSTTHAGIETPRRRGSSVFSMSNVAMSSDPDEVINSILPEKISEADGEEETTTEGGEVANKVSFEVGTPDAQI